MFLVILVMFSSVSQPTVLQMLASVVSEPVYFVCRILHNSQFSSSNLIGQE